MGFFLRPFLFSLAFLLCWLSFSKAKVLVVDAGARRTSSWQIPPSSPADYYNQWAQSKRFKIGDSIVFKYDGKTDSVLRVTEEGYKSCDKSNPLQSYSDGNTSFTFDKSGPFYFISGAQGHCEKGQKLTVIVLSVKPSKSPASSPAGAPDHHSPAPAPSDGGPVNGPSNSPAGAPDHHAPAPAPSDGGPGNGPKAGLVGGLAAAFAILAFV